MTPNSTAVKFLLSLPQIAGVKVMLRICEMPVVDIGGTVVSVNDQYINVQDDRTKSGAMSQPSLRFTRAGVGVDIGAAIVDVTPPEMNKVQAKELALALLGKEPVVVIATKTGLAPSTIANYMVDRGWAPDYNDLTVHNGPHQPRYQETKDALKFATVQDAKDSVVRFTQLMDKFLAAHDRIGWHRVLELALIGRDRALMSGKREQAIIFATWIAGEMVKTAMMPGGPDKAVAAK